MVKRQLEEKIRMQKKSSDCVKTFLKAIYSNLVCWSIKRILKKVFNHKFLSCKMQSLKVPY